MNKHKQVFQSTLALSSLLAAALTAIPAQAQSPGYAYSGGVAVQATGACVRTSSWSKENATKECDPELFPAPKVAAAPPPPPPPAPKPAPKPVIMIFAGAALFATNKADLTPAGQKRIQDYRQEARAIIDSATSVKITGHTDSTGSAEYNQELSVRRAEAVRDYLVKLGGKPSIMQVVGMGASKPIGDNKTAAGRTENRRVEVEATGVGK